jgi:hypothetical protein
MTHIVENSVLYHRPITNQDITSIEDIFEPNVGLFVGKTVPNSTDQIDLDDLKYYLVIF